MYRGINREKLSESHREYQKNNREQVNKEDIKFMLILQKNKCAICSVSVAGGYHIDHVIPLSKGGVNDKSNLQIS